MTSRLSTFAALFAVFAATVVVMSTAGEATAASATSAAPMKVYQLERVVITGKRVAHAD